MEEIPNLEVPWFFTVCGSGVECILSGNPQRKHKRKIDLDRSRWASYHSLAIKYNCFDFQHVMPFMSFRFKVGA